MEKTAEQLASLKTVTMVVYALQALLVWVVAKGFLKLNDKQPVVPA